MESNRLKPVSRRKLLVNSLAVGSGMAFAIASGKAFADVCKVTVPQGEGPYYPEGDLDRDADLVQIRPGDPLATGQIIFISGKVLDVACQPIEAALVEVWQACFSGKYNHSEDPNHLTLDPNFQYWGRARSDANGKFLFRTIVPGHYPNGGNSYRPPHVHFKVHARGFQSLTTQMYFDPRSYDDPKLAEIVAHWNSYENVPASLKVHFTAGIEFGTKRGTFDLTLRRP